MTEMATSGSMSGAEKRSDGPLGESAAEKSPLALGAAGPGRHRASPRLYRGSERCLRRGMLLTEEDLGDREQRESRSRAQRPSVLENEALEVAVHLRQALAAPAAAVDSLRWCGGFAGLPAVASERSERLA
jgi:hypothetical protein